MVSFALAFWRQCVGFFAFVAYMEQRVVKIFVLSSNGDKYSNLPSKNQFFKCVAKATKNYLNRNRGRPCYPSK